MAEAKSKGNELFKLDSQFQKILVFVKHRCSQLQQKHKLGINGLNVEPAKAWQDLQPDRETK